jgi:hypothetical protein
MFLFFNLNPRAIILIRGRSPAHMRLYQMGIASAWQEINERYDILGSVTIIGYLLKRSEL